VLNLLKNDINNAVAVGGANVPKSIVALCREKEVTMFLDGDRGGDIILKEISQVAEIDFVARAPPGREVEELSRKEIIKAVRSRVPFEQINGTKVVKPPAGPTSFDMMVEDRPPRPSSSSPESKFGRMRKPLEGRAKPEGEPGEHRPEAVAEMAEPLQQVDDVQQAPAEPAQTVPKSPGTAPEQLLKSLEELENTLRARLYNTGLEQVNEIPVRDLIKTLGESSGVHAVVFDGIITQRLVDLAESKGTSVLIGVRSGNLFRRPESMLIHTKK
jgi:DNA primase